MANEEHLRILEQGVKVWNQWRKKNKGIVPDLEGADLSGIEGDTGIAAVTEHDRYIKDFSYLDLSGAILRRANLQAIKLTQANLMGAELAGANLSHVYLAGANLTEADASGAWLLGTNLSKAKLRHTGFGGTQMSGVNLTGAIMNKTYFVDAHLYQADFSGATLKGAYFEKADLSYALFDGTKLQDVTITHANLHGAMICGATLKKVDFSFSQLVDTDLSYSTLTDCTIYGSSVWGVKLHETVQKDLVITSRYEPTITVDNLEVAQFIYLLLNNERVRDVVDTITSKAVLILGRFTAERKSVLDALRNELRRHNYLPIMFDFQKPSSRNLTETVSTLAHMARFVIADITDAKSIPQELQRIVPDLPSLPIQPLILASQHEYAMFQDFYSYPWVLEPYVYESAEGLISSLQKVIAPAEAKAKEIEERRKELDKRLSG